MSRSTVTRPARIPAIARRSLFGARRISPRRGLSAAVFLMEIRQYVLAHEFDHFELLVVLHPGPSDPEDEEVTIEAIDAPFELLDNVFGAPEDEAVARQRLEPDAKRFLARQYLVLAPFGVGGIFPLEEWTRGSDRLLACRRDVKLLNRWPRRGDGMAGLSCRILVETPLALDRGECGMRVDEPCVSEPAGTRDRRVGVGGYPYWRMRLLYRPNRARGVVELEEPALESNVILGPEPFDEVERFDHPADLVPRVDAEAFKLDFAIAEPDAEDQPALAHYVEGRYFLSDLDRVEQRQQHDSENKLHIAGVCRKPAQ